jgi:hypothetical protein
MIASRKMVYHTSTCPWIAAIAFPFLLKTALFLIAFAVAEVGRL